MARTFETIAALGVLIIALMPGGTAPGENAFWSATQYEDGFREHDDPPMVFAPRACNANPNVRHVDLTVGAATPIWAWNAPVLQGVDLDLDGFEDILWTAPVSFDYFLAAAWIDTDGDLILDSQTGAVGPYAPGTMAGEYFSAFFAPGQDSDADGRVDCDGAADLNGDHIVDHLYITHDAPGNTAADPSIAVNPSARTFILDGEAPTTVVNVASPNANGWFNTGVNLEIDANDACWLLEYTAVDIDGQPAETHEGEAAFTVNVAEEGAHLVTVQSRDYAHNKDAAQVFAINVDTTPADVSIEAPALLAPLGIGGVALVGDTITVEALAEDAVSGTDIVEFSDSVNGVFATIGAAGDGLHSALWNVPAAAGFVTLTVTVTDLAGNADSASIDVLVLG